MFESFKRPREGRRLGCLLLGDLLNGAGETRGNAVDADSDVASEAVDETGDLTQELILAGELGDGVDLGSGNSLTVRDTALDLQDALGLLSDRP